MMIQVEPNDVPASRVSGAQAAFLGAVVGDALGWPYEGHRAGGIPQDGVEPGFTGWRLQCGTRFQRYFEDIRPGEYSDDTQLMLCVARSRLCRGAWWESFARCELPLWLSYQRGGGRAAKTGAKAWLDGKAPWTMSQAAVNTYFEAGANGVAMRVLPHCVAGLNHTDFGPVAQAIMADGVTTHGHPRALVGALAYGFALWAALGSRFDATTTLCDFLIACQDQWAPLPDIHFAWPDWRKATDAAGNYLAVWESTVGETVELLRTAAGSVGVPEIHILEALGCLGCFKGSGTVTATAACYLTDRSLQGVAPQVAIGIACTARQADTDTLASMAGGLIGAIHGADSLSTWVDTLQDAEYLRAAASALSHLAHETSASESSLPPVESEDLTMFLGSLSKLSAFRGSTITLPDGRRAGVLDVFAMPSTGDGPKFNTTRARTEDGQTVYFHWR